MLKVVCYVFYILFIYKWSWTKLFGHALLHFGQPKSLWWLSKGQADYKIFLLLCSKLIFMSNLKCALISGTYFFIFNKVHGIESKQKNRALAVQKATSSWGADVRLKQGAKMVTTSSSFGQTVGNLTTYIHTYMFYLFGVLWQWPLTHPTPAWGTDRGTWHLKDMFWNSKRICKYVKSLPSREHIVLL